MLTTKEKYGVEVFTMQDDGVFPNNPLLPVIHYRRVFRLPLLFAGKAVSDHFERNKWGNSWVNGIFDFHHYHSITHEVLAATEGFARVQLGGDKGRQVLFEKGDVLILPAGVAHKNLEHGNESRFKCVGAYFNSSDYDLNYGKPGERPRTDENIRKVPTPNLDPVFGAEGELLKYWEQKDISLLTDRD